MEATASLEKPEDAGKGGEGVVKRWLLELDLADQQEKKWREEAKEAIKRYRNERKKAASFNILWSNIEVIQPNVYNTKPRPDVRKRFNDNDPVGKVAAEATERSLSFLMDDYDFDHTIETSLFDMLLPGRGQARVRYVPYFTKQTDAEGKAYEALASIDLQCDHVQWDDFRHGPGKTWKQVSWVAYRHRLTKAQIDEKFPDLSSDITLDYTADDVDSDKADKNPDVFKRATIWEILDKDKRETIFIAPGYTKAPLLVEPDKLKLRDFFDCPRPLMAIFSSSTLVPIVEYEMYKEQAKELDKITGRINKLMECLKYRGIYASENEELRNLQNLDDGHFLPMTSAAGLLQAGGLDKAIWTQPIEEIAKVLAALYQQREQIKQTIYEIMGLGDIMRGSSDPDETLGAQELKAQTGSVRMKRRQKEVQRFIRDLLRIKAEIIAEHFPAEQLALITGIKLPTVEDKALIQQQMQTAQTGGAPDPKAAEVLAKPTWQEVIQLLKTDMLRRFNIDIETDSTIAADQKADREDAVEVIEGIGAFVQNVGPAIESGAMSMEAAKKILVAVIRKAKLGREVEEAIEQDAQNTQPQQEKPDPEIMKVEGELEAKKQQMQADQQIAQAKAQGDHQLAQERQAADQRAMQAKMAAEAQMAHEKLALEREIAMIRLQNEKEIALMKANLEAQVNERRIEGELEISRASAAASAHTNHTKATQASA